MKLIRTEFIKMKRSKMWIPMFVIPIISTLFGSGNYYLNRGILQDKWYSLWTQVSLFYGFLFYAITISIIASYSWRMEHKDNNWNKILALPYKHSQIITSKIVSISIISLCIQLTFIMLYYIVGKFIFQFQTGFPIEVLIWGGIGWFTSIAVCALQSFISMNIKSFSIPIGIALFFCFIGIGFYVTQGLVKNLKYLSPNSLMIVGMSSNTTELLGILEYIKILFSTIIITVMFRFLSIKSIKNKK